MVIKPNVFSFVIKPLLFKVFANKEKITRIDISLSNNQEAQEKIPDFIKNIYDFFDGYLKYGKIKEIPFNQFDFNDSLNTKEYQLLLNLKENTRIGDTITYKELSIKNGFGEKGARVIGYILSRNPFPIIFPCHRVIKTNGDIGGYKWGLELKKFLLQKEKEIIKNKLNFI